MKRRGSVEAYTDVLFASLLLVIVAVIGLFIVVGYFNLAG